MDNKELSNKIVQRLKDTFVIQSCQSRGISIVSCHIAQSHVRLLVSCYSILFPAKIIFNTFEMTKFANASERIFVIEKAILGGNICVQDDISVRL